ncbi:hypothetical protein NVP1138O_16 [Vibrio phage 1.138.O._10N.261.48.A1]|jgi:hypothetical protein|nr:hypothetical protein NVP1138O_16 [Vibrio phage 1.138.O._10N.261.48.A1]
MASNIIVFSGAVAAKDFISPQIPSFATRGIVSQTFYSDEAMQTPVYPTAGTVTYTGSEDGFNYGSLDDSAVNPLTGNYKRASWQLGAVAFIKATMAGITGATHFRIVIAVSD